MAYKLNTKQQYAFERIKSGASVFISGPGGVGKSVLVNRIREEFGDDTIFLAPTGIAAINIQGATFHRTFRFPFGYIGKAARRNVSDKARELFADGLVKRIVIDEISMVRADLLAALDKALQIIKKTKRPFGGLQIVVVGDFFQLPPVLNERSAESKYFYEEFPSPFCFDSESWNSMSFETIELTDIMRQSNEKFIGALCDIRTKNENYARSLQFLNLAGKIAEDVESVDSLFLCTTNKDADAINAMNYEDLEGEEKVYIGKRTGTFKEGIVPEVLNLKVGCKVLICANDQDEQYANGHTGYVEQMFDDSIFVRLETNNQVVYIKQYTWMEYDYFRSDSGGLKCVPTGSFIQFPLKLGYAVTIHKSQGMSLDEANIYIGNGAFAHGQTYVALSRLRTLEGLKILKEIKPTDVIVNERVIEFYESNRLRNIFNEAI